MKFILTGQLDSDADSAVIQMLGRARDLCRIALGDETVRPLSGIIQGRFDLNQLRLAAHVLSLALERYQAMTESVGQPQSVLEKQTATVISVRIGQTRAKLIEVRALINSLGIGLAQEMTRCGQPATWKWAE